MMAEEPAIVADHAFTTGKIAQSGFETPLKNTQEKVGIVDGFGCFPDKVSPAKNTGSFVPDDFEHEIGTNFMLKGKGLVVLTRAAIVGSSTQSSRHKSRRVCKRCMLLLAVSISFRH